MIRPLCLLLIKLYQRFLSPIKGFNCAHHRLHHGDTCSNAIKKIIHDKPLLDIAPLIRARFTACKNASFELKSNQSQALHRADIPCDVGCAGDMPDTNCGPSSRDCGTTPCDLCFEWPKLKRRTQRRIIITIAILSLALAYYYGSQITKIELTALSNQQRNDTLFEKLTSRKAQSLRVLATTHQADIYSNIIDTNTANNGETITLMFKTVVSLKKLKRLEIQDARFSAVNGLIIVGQILETIEAPSPAGVGRRFKYKFKSRWGL